MALREGPTLSLRERAKAPYWEKEREWSDEEQRMYTKQKAVLDDDDDAPLASKQNAQKVIGEIEARTWTPPQEESHEAKAIHRMKNAFQSIQASDESHKKSQALLREKLNQKAKTVNEIADMQVCGVRLKYDAELHKIQRNRELQIQLDKAKGDTHLLDKFRDLCAEYEFPCKKAYIETKAAPQQRWAAWLVDKEGEKQAPVELGRVSLHLQSEVPSGKTVELVALVLYNGEYLMATSQLFSPHVATAGSLATKGTGVFTVINKGLFHWQY